MRRRRTTTATLLAIGLAAAPLVTGCGSDTSAAKKAVLAAIQRTLTSSRTFTFVDHDLVNTTTVSGAIEDDQRYQLLLTSDGVPQWQMAVRDDAVADYFPQPAAVDVYTGSGYGPEDDVKPAMEQMRTLLTPATTQTLESIFTANLPHPQQLPPSLALASLRAGKWVVDPSGAPRGFGGASTAAKQATTNPFYEPMTLLTDLQQRVLPFPGQYIRQWRKDDVSPLFKRTDDPFPAPQPGEQRYDLGQIPLNTTGVNTSRGIPPPPFNDEFLKVAVYVRDGRVSGIRYNYDILDRLNDIVKAYKLPAKFGKSVGVNLEEHVGQVVVDMLQGQREQMPFRVHEETLLFSYPPSPPQVTLPTPAVTAPLTGVIPNQGAPTTTAPGAPPA